MTFRIEARSRQRAGALANLLRILAGASVTAMCLAQSSQLLRESQFKIAAQHLASAIIEFSDQAGIQIISSGNDVANVMTPGVNGRYRIVDALGALLQGTGLGYSVLNDHTVSIRPQGNSTTSSVQSSHRDMPRTSDAAQPAQVDHSKASSDVFVEKQREQASEEKPAQLEQVVVTGTNIRGAAPVGSQLITIDRDQIVESGYSTIDQVIQSLPQVFRGGAESATPDGFNFGSGTLAGLNGGYGAGINLRGLGATSTLTLLNGRRLVSSSGGTLVDISSIPVSAIDRVEILTDGASAIYGADAVAGVVNIILKNDYDGIETRARYGATTEGGRDEFRLGQSVGESWSGGHALLSVDYLHQQPLTSDERSFTQDVPRPTDIFPSNHALSLVFSGSQNLSDSLSSDADAIYSKADRYIVSAGSNGSSAAVPTTVTRIDAGGGLRYNAFGDWYVTTSATYGREADDIQPLIRSSAGAPITTDQATTLVQRTYGAEFKIDGTLFTLPAGAVQLAAGYSHLYQSYDQVFPFYSSRTGVARAVNSEFTEVRIPMVGEKNAVPLVRQLDLSLAVRRDQYSDFGPTTNPKFGIAWTAFEDLRLRGSWGSSFRPPSTGFELQSSQSRSLFVYSTAGTDGVMDIPVAFLSGSKALIAETARNFGAGINYTPSYAPRLALDLNYYNISYSNQITTPPYFVNTTNPGLAAFLTKYPTPAQLTGVVNNYIANGATYLDISNGEFGPNPLSQTTVLYDDRQLNAASTRIAGFDLSVKYSASLGANQLRYTADWTRIDKYAIVANPGALSVSYLNTTGYPASSRARGTVNWSRGPIDGFLAFNYTGSYVDTSSPTRAGVGTYQTVDMSVRFHSSRSANVAERGWTLGLSVTNFLNAAPPYIYQAQAATPGAHYDGANADPLGRFVAVDITREW